MMRLVRRFVTFISFLVRSFFDLTGAAVGMAFNVMLGGAQVIARFLLGVVRPARSPNIKSLVPEKVTAKHIGAALHGDAEPLAEDTPQITARRFP